MEPSEYLILILFICLGIFSVVVFNIDWYFKTDGAMMFVRRLGRKGARIFYAVLGIALITCGVLGMIYW